MRIEFAQAWLSDLYTIGSAKGSKRFSIDVIRAYIRVIDRMIVAANTQQLRTFQALRYEKLRGDRVGQHSLRINDQWRLIVIEESDDSGAFLLVLDIVDYH